MIQVATSDEEKAMLVNYVATKIGTTPQRLVGQMPYEAVFTLRGNKPMGALIYSNYRGTSIEMSAAGEPGWLTRSVVRGMFAYPFIQLKCWTLLCLINRHNSVSREITKRLGFNELCVIESGKGRSSDIVLYGMTRNKCLWIEDSAAVRQTDHVNGAIYG